MFTNTYFIIMYQINYDPALIYGFTGGNVIQNQRSAAICACRGL